MKRYALLGKHLSHSFSEHYFNEKFKRLKLQATYKLCEMETIGEFPDVMQRVSWNGFNVTSPYKESIIPLLDTLDNSAQTVGAVNTIKVYDDGSLEGYNTDMLAFKECLEPLLKSYHTQALILGTGGASKAVQVALTKLGIGFKIVSRQHHTGIITYDQLDDDIIEKHLIIINATPVGMYPNYDQCPNISFRAINSQHLCFDLIYNPELTSFLEQAQNKGATINNGLQMLYKQADLSFNIWNAQ